MNHHQSQQFFTQLIEETAPTCQPLIGGIADFHLVQGWISQKQSNAVKITHLRPAWNCRHRS